MAVSLLSRLAVAGDVPVFVVPGAGAREAVDDLLAADGLYEVATPRHATVLLVAGGVPVGMFRALAQVHDQLPFPRATVWWSATPPRAPGALPHSDEPQAAPAPLFEHLVHAGPGDAVTEVVRAAHREVVTGARPSSPDLLPADNPVEWRGVGPHGTGGEGMMGGKPYGRPMAMTGPDVRDGLALDRVPLRLGPLLTGLPAGLVLAVELQGDVIVSVEVEGNPFDDAEVIGAPPHAAREPFARAAHEPVALRDLELARARHGLHVAARLLALHGLGALARRVRRVAVGLRVEDRDRVERLRRRVTGRAVLGAALGGLGHLHADDAPPGPFARAAGRADDARSDDPAYAGLGFAPHSEAGGDALARLRQHLAEAVQALDLAARAGDRTTTPGHPVEGLRGPVGGDSHTRLLAAVPGLLRGREWAEAIVTVASLDLALDESARRTAAEAGA